MLVFSTSCIPRMFSFVLGRANMLEIINLILLKGGHSMENTDRELILQLSPTNPRLKKLYDQHLKLDKMIVRFENYAVYSPSAELRAKELKLEKLRGVDEMMKILNEEREAMKIAI